MQSGRCEEDEEEKGKEGLHWGGGKSRLSLGPALPQHLGALGLKSTVHPVGTRARSDSQTGA